MLKSQKKTKKFCTLSEIPIFTTIKNHINLTSNKYIMKKLLLLAGVALSNFVAIAQQNQSVVMTTKNLMAPQKRNVDLNKLKADKISAQQAVANKGTAGGSRWYNFVDMLSDIDPNVAQNSKITWLWHKADMLSTYGTTLDTVWVRSFGTSLDPSTVLFNTSALYPGQVAIRSTDAYKVDSAIVYGFYERKAGSTTTDTLRVSFIFGYGNTTNMPVYYFTGMASSFGKDTVRFAHMFQDSVRNIAAKNTGVTTAVVVVDKLLTAASVNDTTSSGLNYFKIAVPNFNVPANGIVGMSVAYKYGAAYTPYSTMYTGTAYNFNAFTGLWYEQNASGFPTYVDGEYNTGFIATQPIASTNSWFGDYVPTWAYTAPFGLEYPYVDIKLSCTACNITGVADVKSTIESVVASPNPATDALSISFNTTENATTKVAIMNMLGQEVDAKTISSVANTANKVVFNVANLNAGIYLYSITSNGQTVSNRFVVAH